MSTLMSERDKISTKEASEKLLKWAVEEAGKSYAVGIWTPTSIGTSTHTGTGHMTPGAVYPAPPTPLTGHPTPFLSEFDDTPYHLLVDFCMRNDIWLRRTGSQLIEGIKPNDLDYVADDPSGKLEEWLNTTGWTRGGSEREEEEFTSYKQGKYNVIICHTREYFTKYLMATELLVKLQPKTKQERIDIFDTVIGTKNNPETMVPF